MCLAVVVHCLARWSTSRVRFMDHTIVAMMLPKTQSSFEIGWSKLSGHTFTVGVGLLHAGKRRHGAAPISSGDRVNLIVWARSSSYRMSKEYQVRADCALAHDCGERVKPGHEATSDCRIVAWHCCNVLFGYLVGSCVCDTFLNCVATRHGR